MAKKKAKAPAKGKNKKKPKPARASEGAKGSKAATGLMEKKGKASEKVATFQSWAKRTSTRRAITAAKTIFAQQGSRTALGREAKSYLSGTHTFNKDSKKWRKTRAPKEGASKPKAKKGRGRKK